MTPTGSGDWLAVIDLEADTDLQQLAIAIAQNPQLSDGGWFGPDDPEWGSLAERWDALKP